MERSREMTREDFYVGQTVYLFHEWNCLNGLSIEDRIVETKVISVGRKYLAVDHCGQMKFDMTNNFEEKTLYTPKYTLHLSKEAIYRKIETQRQYRSIRDELERHLWRVPLEGLQEIKAVIDKYAPDNL